MQRNETETHSRFLYELLSPNGLHGESEVFLEKFLQQVLGLKSSSEGFEIRREDPTEYSRRIDLTLTSPKTLIGIEIKIDAGDQHKQLFDYYQELKRRAKPGQAIWLYYLTLEGKDASKSSLYKLRNKQYQCLSFEHDIHLWLSNCVQHSALKPVLREAIYQYQLLIESLTGRNQDMSNAIAATLLETPETLEAALEIEKALQEAKVQLQHHFWQDLYGKLKRQFDTEPQIKKGSNLKDISRRYYHKTNNNKNTGFCFPIPGGSTDSEVWIDINLYHSVHYGVRTRNNQGQFVSLPDTERRTMRDKSGHGNAIADNHSDWVNSFYFPPTGKHQEEINFYSFEGLVRKLSDPTVMDTVTDEIVNHIAQLIKPLTESKVA